MTIFGQGARIDTPMGRAMRAARATLRSVAFFSFFINLLALTSSVYMLQIYDRVLASRSEATLLYLTLFATACLATLAGLETVRSRLLVRLGARFDAQLSGLVFGRTLSGGRSSQSLRDLDQVRGFVTGATMLSLLDAPWMPLYIGLVYLLHPWLGHVALAGGVVLFVLGVWNERSTREPLAEAGKETAAGNHFAETSARNAEVIRAMGMLPGLAKVWRERHDFGLGLQGLASDKAATIAAVAKAVRLFLQIAVLGVGALLVIKQETTAGVMIAASIVMGRALAPLEAAIGGWRGFLGGTRVVPAAGRSDRHPGRRASADAAAHAARRAGVRVGSAGAARSTQAHGAEPEVRARARDSAWASSAPARRASRRWRAAGRRRVAAGRRRGPARRRRASRTGTASARPAASATCRRTSSCSTARWPQTSRASASAIPGRRRGGPAGRRARDDPRPARRLRHGDRRGRRQPVGRPAPAGRPGTGASMPARR